MLHSISETDSSKKPRLRGRWIAALVCIGILLIGLLSYTVAFLRSTDTLEYCLQYPYAKESKLVEIENETAAKKHRAVYLSVQNADGIQEMYLLQNKRFLKLFDVQRYFVLQHAASPMEKVGFFSTLAPLPSEKKPIDWYFYSQNDLQIAKMVCTFNTVDGERVTREFSCNANEPFVCCIPEMQSAFRLENMTGYTANGEMAYTFDTGL